LLQRDRLLSRHFSLGRCILHQHRRPNPREQRRIWSSDDHCCVTSIRARTKPRPAQRPGGMRL